MTVRHDRARRGEERHDDPGRNVGDGSGTGPGAGSGATPQPAANVVVWTALTKASATGGTSAEVHRVRRLPGRRRHQPAAVHDGSVSFTVSVGHRLVVGLGRDTSTDTSYAIDYAFSFCGGSSWEIREGGPTEPRAPSRRLTCSRSRSKGRRSSTYRNGTLVYTSMSRSPARCSSTPHWLPLARGAGLDRRRPRRRRRPLPPRLRPSGTTLRVLQWNIHHGGFGTDGVYDTEPRRDVDRDDEPRRRHAERDREDTPAGATRISPRSTRTFCSRRPARPGTTCSRRNTASGTRTARAT